MMSPRLLKVPRSELEIDYLGMNHLGWIIGLRDAEHDLMDHALDQIDQLRSLGVNSTYIRMTRAIPIPYVRYYLHPEHILRLQEGKIPRARQLQMLEQELLADYELSLERNEDDLSTKVARRGAVWYSAIVVPVLDALINDRSSTWVVNIAKKRNISWLSPETVIEVPSKINRNGAHPLQADSHESAEDLASFVIFSSCIRVASGLCNCRM